ncbi:MAG: CDP-glucose 4,6-dehydratase [Raoultibacter sp.]
MEDTSFYRGKTVLVTGHTGFKGSWLCAILSAAGAQVVGYALEPPTNPSLFAVAHIEKRITSIVGDIRDYEKLLAVLEHHKPEIVFHLAAQPIVLDGYRAPRYTYETNVMGTVNLLEAVRLTDCVKSLVNVTTDKVYLNAERDGYGYREDDPLDGFDPYSNSKSCSDLVTHSYAQSFLAKQGVAVSVARAGNVIGGGDFAPNRIIPDCVRAVESNTPLIVRNPYSTRPYQHVLEPLFAYLAIAQRQYEESACASSYNVGPDDCDCVTTGDLVGLFSQSWGEGFAWENVSKEASAPHEATFLKLDSSKLARALGWKPKWHISDAISATVEWSRAYLEGHDIEACMHAQIERYLRGN